MRCRRLPVVLASLVSAASCTASSAGSRQGPDTSAPVAATATTVIASTTISPDPSAAGGPSATTTTSASTTGPSTTTGPEPFALVGPGRFAVGVQTITIDDGKRNRPLTVDVWFPITADPALPPHDYTLLPGVYYRSPGAVSATPDNLTGGPFPLVVYSHGSGGLRYIHAAYTEAIASHGYIVAAPDHTGNTAVERITGQGADPSRILLDRPDDVRAVIDAMTDTSHPTAGGFAAHVDPARIAVTGHSLGGFTAYAMAAGYANELGSTAPDPRVRAIVTLAPATGGLADEELARVAIPAMTIVGTDDKTTPVVPNVERAWSLTTGRPSYRVELVHAEHQTFTDLCRYQTFLPTLTAPVPEVVKTVIDEFAVEGCSPGDMPIDRATDLTTTFAITFLDSVFAGGHPIDPATTAIPDDVRYLVK